MRSVLDGLSEESRRLLVPERQPDWIPPMLATLTERRFSDPRWIFERKLDGERCLAFRSGSEVRMLSRNREVINASYPEIVEGLRGQAAGDFVVDGEVVAFEGRQTSFARLQRRMHVRDPERARQTGVPVFVYLFDLLHVDGHDCTALKLIDRKALLRRLLTFDDPLRFTIHRRAAGEAFWREACGKGWEGVIAKRADSAYMPRRSPDWLKFKCVNEQEFVIGGYTDPQGSRKGLGAILVGYFDGDRLRYAGKVGTGFNEETLAGLKAKLTPLERGDPPFVLDTLPRQGVHWVEPKLVCQIGFTEWTGAGRLRHPRFLGLRRDKRPTEVVREQPA
jgi:bifunctional non-homologous end joining protein LigD